MTKSTKKNGATPPTSPQAASPPGIILRSGRKSKRPQEYDDSSVGSASVASRSSRASRGSRASLGGGTHTATRASRRKRKSVGDESDVPLEISRRKRKKEIATSLEVVDEDVAVEEKVAGATVEMKSSPEKKDEVMEEKGVEENGAGDQDEDMDMGEQKMGDEIMKDQQEVDEEKKHQREVDEDMKEQQDMDEEKKDDGKNEDSINQTPLMAMAPPVPEVVVAAPATAITATTLQEQQLTSPTAAAAATKSIQPLNNLRLLSQQTPKQPAQTPVTGMTPAPPNSRGLLFGTAKKKEVATKLTFEPQELGRDDGQMMEEMPPTGQMEEMPPTVHSEISTASIACSHLKSWLVVLVSIFVAINMVSFLNGDVQAKAFLQTNVRVLNVEKFSEENARVLDLFSHWDVRRNAVVDSPAEEQIITIESDEVEEEIIENKVHVVDPALLNESRKKLETQRRQEYELNKLDFAINHIQNELDAVDELIKTLSADSDVAELLSFDEFDASLLDNEADQINSQLNLLSASTGDKMSLLSKWEEVLTVAEENMSQFLEGEIEHSQMDSILYKLSKASLIGAPARIMDTSKIIVPGEGCKGQDYTHVAMEDESTHIEEIDVVGGIDIEALDLASDAPVRLEDAQAAFDNLMKYAQSTVESLIGQGLSPPLQSWVHHLIEGEWKKKGLEKPPTSEFEPLVTQESNIPVDGNGYTELAALNDIDRLIEIEMADRTGVYDHASVIYGARVLHRGPYATSSSLYESLPLFNRLLAYTKLRFYGHPPEVALLPSSTYGRGQCWSFPEERRRSTNGEVRGEYGTLTVSLGSAAFVTEVVVEHYPYSNDVRSAVKDFRVLGFEDAGAFGEPYELGSFHYDTGGKFSMQRFSIPDRVNSMSVPKLKAISLAVDSNWGADFTCLYRFRVHGSE